MFLKLIQLLTLIISIISINPFWAYFTLSNQHIFHRSSYNLTFKLYICYEYILINPNLITVAKTFYLAIILNYLPLVLDWKLFQTILIYKNEQNTNSSYFFVFIGKYFYLFFLFGSNFFQSTTYSSCLDLIFCKVLLILPV